MKMPTKICTKCKEDKSLEEFYFNSSRQSYLTICKKCIRIRRSKSISEETRQKNIKRSRKYYEENRDILLQKQKEYNKKNRSPKYHKDYYIKNCEKIKEKRKRYYLNNKKHELNRNKQYTKNNKGVCNAVKRKYDYTKLNATPKWADLEKIKVLYEKAIWLESITGIKYHVDHVVPLQGENVCGLHIWENLQILEASLNCSKKNKFNTKNEDEDDY